MVERGLPLFEQVLPRPANRAGSITQAAGLYDRREHHAIPLVYAPLARATPDAEYVRGGRAHQNGSPSLQVEQGLLELYAERVTPQPSSVSGHPVTGNDDRDGVGGERRPDGAGGFCAADRLRQPPVGSRLPEGDSPRSFEDPPPKRGQTAKV